MDKKEETVLGFPRGRVAKTLRRILYPELSDKEVDIIIVVLFSHLMVESAIEDLIFKLFTFGMPGKENKRLDEEMQKEVFRNITAIPFMKKFQLIKPVVGKDYTKVLEAIATVRNDIIHVRRKKEAIMFKGKPIWQEKTLAKYFNTCYGTREELWDWCETVDFFKAKHKKWAEKLKELGISLF